MAAVYGWPVDLWAAETVTRFVARNAQSRAEEAEGLVRWLPRRVDAAPRAKLGAMLRVLTAL
jgi:hypothetical protein